MFADYYSVELFTLTNRWKGEGVQVSGGYDNMIGEIIGECGRSTIFSLGLCAYVFVSPWLCFPRLNLQAPAIVYPLASSQSATDFATS